MSSMLRSSKCVRYFVGLARNIVISTRQDIDGSLLQRSQHLAGVTSSFSTTLTSFQSGSNLEKALKRLDQEARLTGRISLREIEDALSEIQSLKKATTSQSLMVIRCCGNLVPEATPEQRTQLVNEIWHTLNKLGVSLDISHYNALLKVYLENEHKFSPTEFLADLEKKGVEPNRVTYQRLIAGYCQMGDIGGATRILEFMKEKQLPVNEGVFNALVLGHCKAEDMQSAESMLGVMRQANVEPTNETYCILMCGYAQLGDREAVDRLLTECKVKDVLLSDRDILEVAYAAALGGHHELMAEVLKNVKHMVGYNQDAANMIMRMITKEMDEPAFQVFLTMSPVIRSDGIPSMSGHILIKQMVKYNRSADKILNLCDRLEKTGHTKMGLWMALESSFHQQTVNLTLDLLRAYRDKGEPIRNHYFWPSLIAAGRNDGKKRMQDILALMVSEFNIFPNVETVQDYYLPHVDCHSPETVVEELMKCGVRRGVAVVSMVNYLVSRNKLTEAVNIGLQHLGLTYKPVYLVRMLVDSLQRTGDVKNAVALVHIMVQANAKSDLERGEEEEEFLVNDEIPGRFLVGVSSFRLTRNKTEAVLKEMVEQGLGISNSCAEQVQNILQGNELTPEISQLLATLSSGELTPVPLKKRPGAYIPAVTSPAALEKTRERLKATKGQEELVGITRKLFNLYCYEYDLENALRIKKEWEEDLKQEVTQGMWAQLLGVYCHHGDLDSAKQTLDKIRESAQDLELDPSKVLNLVKLYVQHGQLDEGIKLLQSVKMRDEKGFQVKASCFQALTAVTDATKDPEQVKKLLTALDECKLTDINNVTLGPVIKAYLLRDDMEGALREFESCVKKYRATPWKNEIATRLIEKEDAANLQTLVDLSTEVHGEINSLYDLVMSFVECGRVRQARKILETPGLQARNDRLHFACERYRNEGKVQPLEGLVEATKDLPYIDRSEIYYNLLETYCQADDVDKALGLWTKMQDEDVQVTDPFLLKLGSFLKEKGMQVPFAMPQSTSGDIKVEKTKERPVRSRTTPLMAALNSGNLDEALTIRESLVNRGKPLTVSEINRLIEVMVDKKRYREAVSVLTSLPLEQYPQTRCLKYLLGRLAADGEVDLMKRLGDSFSEDLKKATSFTNKYMSCATEAGKATEELDNLEKAVDNATTPDELDSLSFSFPRGGIFAVLNASPDYHEQVERIVQKYYSKGVSGPANCLCLYLLMNDQLDKAKHVYEQYKLNNISQFMFQNLLSNARISTKTSGIENLLALAGDHPAMTADAKGTIYSNLINIYLKKGEATKALEKLEEGLKHIPLEKFYPSTLYNLKTELESKNIPFKYTIPTRKTKQASSSSSSSSDSDTEPSKTVAAKQ